MPDSRCTGTMRRLVSIRSLAGVIIISVGRVKGNVLPSTINNDSVFLLQVDLNLLRGYKIIHKIGKNSFISKIFATLPVICKHYLIRCGAKKSCIEGSFLLK